MGQAVDDAAGGDQIGALLRGADGRVDGTAADETEPPTNAMVDLSALETNTNWTSSPCLSKKPCLLATQSGL